MVLPCTVRYFGCEVTKDLGRYLCYRPEVTRVPNRRGKQSEDVTVILAHAKLSAKESRLGEIEQQHLALILDAADFEIVLLRYGSAVARL